MLTSPSEYINYYKDILKNEFNFNDLKIDYHGFVGFMINMFAMTNFDIKTYYDYLFKEGFLETCEENNNIYLHAAKYGYNPSFAAASTAIGNLVFDFSKLPRRPSNVYKREVILPSPLEIQINGSYTFTSTHQYRFIEEVSNNISMYYCIISSPNDRIRIINSTTPTITAPFIDFKQYQTLTHEYSTSNYEYGTYHTYQVNISDNKYLSNLTANVKKYGTTDLVSYDIKTIKAFETSLSKVLFMNKISDKAIDLEAGNGYHGEWIPNARVYLNLYLTDGSSGNIITFDSARLVNNSLNYITYDINSNIISQNTIRSGLIVVDFHSSSGGSDPLFGNDLKQDVFKWIESRNNLINQNDFYNLFSRNIKDFSITFKKNQINDNNFYIFKAIRDQYQNLLFSTNYTYRNIDYENKDLIQNIKSSQIYDETSTLEAGRYYYKIVAIDKFTESLPSASIIEDVVENRSVTISWDPVEGAEQYKVFGRTPQFLSYWIVDNTPALSGKIEFVDNGNNSNIIQDNILNTYKIIKQVAFPVFKQDFKTILNLTAECSWILTPDGIYYINNRSFYYEPSSITYDITTVLKKVSALDQLITNSWTIVNNILYLKLDNLFNTGTSKIEAIFTKTLEFVSPFIYRYNSFLNWYEAYLLYDNQVLYPVNTYIADGFTPPILYVNIVYNYIDNITNLYVKSYQDLALYTIKIKVDNIDNNYITLTYDSVNDYFQHTIQDFISTPTKIDIELYNTNTLSLKIKSILQNVQQVYPIRDQISLSNYYDENNIKYITNIPVLSYTDLNNSLIEYDNREYILSQLYEYTVSSNLSQNRMQSDSVQTRFLNTIFCDSYTSQRLLKQKYNTNILLPLNISINIKYNNSNIDFTKHQIDIETLVAQYLQDYATGINIIFYPSKIIDLIHSYSPDIISVIINVYDSYGTLLNDGIETLTEEMYLQIIPDKLRIVQHTSIYWWWNLNNITISLGV